MLYLIGANLLWCHLNLFSLTNGRTGFSMLSDLQFYPSCNSLLEAHLLSHLSLIHPVPYLLLGKFK